MVESIAYEETGLYRQRHSAAHILAQAVVELFPGAKLGVGPPIDDGFYYDFELSQPLTSEDLPRIERRMCEIIRENAPFVYREVTPEEARQLFANQPYKLELVDAILAGVSDADGKSDSPGSLSTYRHGSFEDLCRGPHVRDAGELHADALKLMSIAGAYWRGDERRPMLQRIYGTLWESKEALEQYLWRLEESRKRDHRKIGEDLDLFTFSQEIGRGLPLWLPKGTIIRDELEKWAKETERKLGYQHVATPHISRSELYRISGHLPYFSEDLYPPLVIESDEYYLKPMNCPHHHMLYKSRPHSYRELPIRYAEYGTVYRYESSGQMHGLMRVRGFTQNDAHIYCAPESARDEFLRVMKLHQHYYAALGLRDYHMVLGLRDPNNREKYHGDDSMWTEAEQITRDAMDESRIPYGEDIGSAAHYGPKVDFVIRSVTGKEFAISTNQVDLYMPHRFYLTIVDKAGRAEHVVVLHRAPLGSHERFVGFLIEHFAGAFPVWLAPTQARLIPIADRHAEYARMVAQRLLDLDLRIDVDDTDERMQNKIRKAELQKIPFMLVVGDREAAADQVAIRVRSGENLGVKPIGEFAALLKSLVQTRSLALLPKQYSGN
jgi:threonyl-tRNA synthetase